MVTTGIDTQMMCAHFDAVAGAVFLLLSIHPSVAATTAVPLAAYTLVHGESALHTQ